MIWYQLAIKVTVVRMFVVFIWSQTVRLLSIYGLTCISRMNPPSLIVLLLKSWGQKGFFFSQLLIVQFRVAHFPCFHVVAVEILSGLWLWYMVVPRLMAVVNPVAFLKLCLLFDRPFSVMIYIFPRVCCLEWHNTPHMQQRNWGFVW